MYTKNAKKKIENMPLQERIAYMFVCLQLNSITAMNKRLQWLKCAV